MALYKLTLDPVPTFMDYSDTFAFKDAGNAAVDLTGFGSQWTMGIGKGRASSREDYAVLFQQTEGHIYIADPATGIMTIYYTPELLANIVPENDYYLDLFYYVNNRPGLWGYGTITCLGPAGGG